MLDADLDYLHDGDYRNDSYALALVRNLIDEYRAQDRRITELTALGHSLLNTIAIARSEACNVGLMELSTFLRERINNGDSVLAAGGDTSKNIVAGEADNRKAPTGDMTTSAEVEVDEISADQGDTPHSGRPPVTSPSSPTVPGATSPATNRTQVYKSSGEWVWICDECGWKGLDCGTVTYARREAERHVCPNGADGSVPEPTTATERRTHVPKAWADKPEEWWEHVDACCACSLRYKRPAVSGSVSTEGTE